nr:solute carrier family 39 (zinc transporter), member 9 [Cryptococcus depauperatus CBS 7841]
MGMILLLVQSVCMFAASFIVGSLPLWLQSTASDTHLKAINVLGMGLLVGAALTIIIPEGVSALYEALPKDSHDGSVVHPLGLSVLSGFSLMLLIESVLPHPPHPASPASSPFHSPTPSLDETSRPPNQHLNSQTPMIYKTKRMTIDEGVSETSALQGMNATLGLVIHGVADGIALGASSLAAHRNGSLGLVVFLAVLVHKGPTALGLTTTLLSLSLSAARIRRRLVIFSFAAPVGAILTYLLIHWFGSALGPGDRERPVRGDALGWWTGIALLFSGGSFLYVATVIQPLSSTADTPSHPESHERTLGRYTRAGLLVAGMVLPLCLSLLVGDVH